MQEGWSKLTFLMPRCRSVRSDHIPPSARTKTEQFLQWQGQITPQSTVLCKSGCNLESRQARAKVVALANVKNEGRLKVRRRLPGAESTAGNGSEQLESAEPRQIKNWCSSYDQASAVAATTSARADSALLNSVDDLIGNAKNKAQWPPVVTLWPPLMVLLTPQHICQALSLLLDNSVEVQPASVTEQLCGMPPWLCM